MNVFWFILILRMIKRAIDARAMSALNKDYRSDSGDESKEKKEWNERMKKN